MIGNRALMLPDGVHPNAAGVQRIADRVAPAGEGGDRQLLFFSTRPVRLLRRG
ncbi:hypothetical protein AB5I41_23450 [Sphingomonas sp. MMS24-JH45]